MIIDFSFKVQNKIFDRTDELQRKKSQKKMSFFFRRHIRFLNSLVIVHNDISIQIAMEKIKLQLSISKVLQLQTSRKYSQKTTETWHMHRRASCTSLTHIKLHAYVRSHIDTKVQESETAKFFEKLRFFPAAARMPWTF